MKHITLLLTLPVLLLAACTHEKPAATKAADDRVPVKILALQQPGAMQSIEASGQFTTDDDVMLSFKIGGIIDRIYVKEGDAVRQGQLLAVLKLTEIDAQVQQAALAFDKAQRDHARVTNLYKDSVATLEQLQNAKTALDVAKQQLDAAKFNRSYAEIRATKDGYILHKMANEGQLVSPGVAVLQANGARSSAWTLKVGLSDKQWAAIDMNDKASIHCDALGSETINGEVTHKSQGVDPATGSLTADIRLLGKTPAAIAAGMYGKAQISTHNDDATGKMWQVPYEALLDADGSMGYVFVANADSTASKVKITIQGMDKNTVLVSDGLQNVQNIIVAGSAYLTDKSKIRIVQ